MKTINKLYAVVHIETGWDSENASVFVDYNDAFDKIRNLPNYYISYHRVSFFPKVGDMVKIVSYSNPFDNKHMDIHIYSSENSFGTEYKLL